jgi:tetratricopeptide (TPR) repeat protein
MKTNRAFTLLGVLWFVLGAGAAARLDRWFMGWQGNRAKDFNPLRFAIGEGQKIFAGHFYRKADVYFHSGMYPSIFDNNESFKTAHMAEDAGAAGSRNTGDEENFLGKPRDIIDHFSRHFFPTHHTHLDQGGAAGHSGGPIELADGQSGEVREILPWLKLASELDPEEPLTYTVTAYWLRSRMGKTREAESVLREGLENLPNHPALLFELGRIYLKDRRDPVRARNLWQRAAGEWQKQEAPKADPDTFIVQQIHAYLAQLEEEAGNFSAAISHWEQTKAYSPASQALQERINELRLRQSSARDNQDGQRALFHVSPP